MKSGDRQRLAILLVCFVAPVTLARAPRSYVPRPPGSHYGTLYVRNTWGDRLYADGQLVADHFDYSKLEYELDYTRFFLVGSKLCRFDGVVGYDTISLGSTGVKSHGWFDPSVMLSVFLINDPEHKFNLGLTQVFSPAWGHYEADKGAINAGQNRWRTKSELGMSKWFGDLCAELIANVLCYGDNHDFGPSGATLNQDARLGLETHLSYDLNPRQHLALSYYYAFGGESSLDGVPYSGDLKAHSIEATASTMVKKKHQLRLFYRQDISRENGLMQHLVGLRLVHIF